MRAPQPTMRTITQLSTMVAASSTTVMALEKPR
jgi:hypothetical protein